MPPFMVNYKGVDWAYGVIEEHTDFYIAHCPDEPEEPYVVIGDDEHIAFFTTRKDCLMHMMHSTMGV